MEGILFVRENDMLCFGAYDSWIGRFQHLWIISLYNYIYYYKMLVLMGNNWHFIVPFVRCVTFSWYHFVHLHSYCSGRGFLIDFLKQKCTKLIPNYTTKICTGNQYKANGERNLAVNAFENRFCLWYTSCWLTFIVEILTKIRRNEIPLLSVSSAV